MVDQFPSWLRNYNIVWEEPSRDALDSMPLSGRLGAGANVWVQEGALWLYLAHNEAYDENGRLLKLGCLRLRPASGILDCCTVFRQELDLATGTIVIQAEDVTAGRLLVQLWFSGETLIIETQSSDPDKIEVSFGSWRDETREGIHLDIPVDVWDRKHTVRADEVRVSPEGIVWWHQNSLHSSELDEELKCQPWASNTLFNPADSLVFGGALAATEDLSFQGKARVCWQTWTGQAWSFTTGKSSAQSFAIALRARRGSDPSSWQDEANRNLDPGHLKEERQAEEALWKEFWSRSHIIINPRAGKSDLGWQVGRNYQLFRYMTACNRGGSLPLLFNGGIFTADHHPGRITGNNGELPIDPKRPSSPDFRRWLFCHFMAQNQRWLGWPALASGDHDLVGASIAFYRDRAKTAQARAHTLGAQGVVFPEPLKIWGLCWNAQRDGLCSAEHLTYNFSMMLEFAWMALCSHTVLGTDIRPDIDWIRGTLSFYDSFYRTENKRRTGSEFSPESKLVIYPANSIELAVGAKNPVEVAAGLYRVASGLLALPEPFIPEDTRTALRRFLDSVPDLPIQESGDGRVLIPAESYEKEFNLWELPELYAAWPYRLLGVIYPQTLETARRTWTNIPAHRARLCKQDLSWMPAAVNMAALGLAEEARNRVIDKLSDQKAQVRFPAFFGPGHDWLPDHNWGGSGMVGLQEMLMASDPFGDEKILLLPAWPRDWDVFFKLHGPRETTVEAACLDGRLAVSKVSPPERRSAIVEYDF